MRIAAIDVGTHSIHLLTVTSTKGDSFEVLDRAKAMVKIGAGVFETGELPPRSFAVGLQTLQRYALLAESLGAHHIDVVATSVLREAANSARFIDAVAEATGLEIQVISGWQQAQLIHRAVQHAVELGDSPSLIIDLGGGSVELVVGDRQSVQWAESLRLGTQRLLDGLGNPTGPWADAQIDGLTATVKASAAPVLAEAMRKGVTRAIGTSGTWRALGHALRSSQNGSDASRPATQSVRRRDLARLVRHLAEATPEVRIASFGIAPNRAEGIHIGALVALELLTLSGLEEITICNASLREGVILDFLDRHAPELRQAEEIQSVRYRAVVELAQKYGRGDVRDEHIANLALMLFDQLFPIHELGPAERELLHFAALLHAVGQQIGFDRRQEHSAYVIRHARLRGFNGKESIELALIAQHHRDKTPKKRDKRFGRLPKRDQKTVRLLAALLRLAVALDRGQTQQVKRVELEIKTLEVIITIHGTRDLELELWAARGKVLPLAKALGRRVRLRRGDGQTALPSLPAPAGNP